MLPEAKRQELLVAIEPLRQRVAQWRATKSRNERMPESIWEEATGLAKTFGVAAVQGILRIDYRGLKRRALGVSTPPPAPPGEPRFVELPPLLATTGRAEHTVELEDGAGRRLSVRVARGQLREVLTLLQAFWRP